MMRLSLRAKIAAIMVVLVLVPLLVASYLAEDLSRVAANFDANEAEARIAPLEAGANATRQLFETTKRLHSEIAARLAAKLPSRAPSQDDLDAMLAHESDIQYIAYVEDGKEQLRASRQTKAGAAWRIKEVEHPIPAMGQDVRLRAGFWVPADLQQTLVTLGETIIAAKQTTSVQSALPRSYRGTFILLLTISTLASAAVAIGLAHRLTSRLAVLVRLARNVSTGDATARAPLVGNDEITELGTAFNAMLDTQAAQRDQIDYLQRIGAWQEVARRLAHEIKNPLSPIQLSVQQCVSSYPGGDERFAKTLALTGQIVEEEIGNLRRLVDAFRDLGQLPRVEPVRIALRDVLTDLLFEASLSERVTLNGPDAFVMADRLLLRRALINIADNGVQAGLLRGDGRVVIRWAVDAARVIITIDDHGGGVPDALRAAIFEPYVTHKQGGTGLGLPIAKKIILDHGGTLTLSAAPAPTGGARFVVELPLARVTE